jgi:hypothetical protein
LFCDVGDLQRDHLAHAQAGAIGDGRRRLALEVRRCGDEPGYLIAAEHHRQRVRHAYGLHPGHQLSSAERDVEEELQSGEGGIERDGRGALIDQIQLEAAQILDGGGVG